MENNIYNLIHDVQKFLKQQESINEELFTWQLLQEEKLETKLLINIKNAKKQMIENYNTLFGENYTKRTQGFNNLIKILLDTTFNPRVRYDTWGMYRFKWFTIPIGVRDFLSKKSGTAPGEIINVIGDIPVEPFSTDMKSVTNASYKAGGQSGFATIGLEQAFKIIDDSDLKWLEQFETNLATSMTQEVSTKVRFELLEGMRNLESIPQIRKRIEAVWDESSMDIIVPPKIDEAGKLLRAGYFYSIPAADWATTVARTEVSRAFAMGRLTAYEQMGVVDRVQWLVSDDEKLCPVCGVMEGETFTLQEAQNLIPLHPQCRCTWIPLIADYVSARQQAMANLAELYE